MKILYHHRIASKDGQYVHIEEIISSLRELGHEVVVCEPSSIQSTQFGKESKIVKSVRTFLPRFIQEIAELFYSVPDYWRLRRSIKKHKPECIYERYNLFLLSGIWASNRFGIPILSEVNAPLFSERLKNDGISLKVLAKWTEDYVWRRADHVLPVTEVLAKLIEARGVSRERIKVIPNGINKRFFLNIPQVTNIDSRYMLKGKLVLGFSGFVREWHGLDRVLKMISEHPVENWHLLLVGDGPDRSRLERIARDLNVSDRFTVTGIVSRKEMPEMVQRFDIALQPDVVAYASPLKMFEYMSMAKPILAPDTKNIGEILVNEENALLFDEEKDSFANQLIRLCTNSILRKELGMSARDTIDKRKLYWDNNAEIIVSLFKKCLEENY